MRELLFIIAISFSFSAVGKDYQSGEREIDRYYANELKYHTSIFQTLPITHITPYKNDFIWALKYQYLDAEVMGKPRTPSQAERGFNEAEMLKLDGQSIAPFIGYSHHSLGLGLSGEFGNSQSLYRDLNKAYREKGNLRFSGVGSHLFFNPTAKTRNTAFTVIAGGKVLNVIHKARLDKEEEPNSGSQELKYKVYKSEVGANIAFKAIEFLSVIPWINYTKTFMQGFARSYEESRSKELSPRFAGDADIFWESDPEFNYGIDLAFRFNNLQFHVGNVLGFVLSSKEESQSRIKDYSLNLGILFRTGNEQ